MKQITFSIVATFGFLATLPAYSKLVKLDDYLERVKEAHSGYRGALQASRGAGEKAEGASLILSPQFYANGSWNNDQRQTTAPSFQGTQTLTEMYEFGFRKLTRFGLQAKLSYNLGFTNIVGATILPISQFYDARPTLELTQSLWKNGFGGETRAGLATQTAASLAVHYSEAFRAKGILNEAESTYWGLSLARATLAVQKQTLDRAHRILEWANRRVGSDLADRSDSLAAEAAYQTRQLDLQSAADREQSARRKWNSLLGVETDEVEDELETLDVGMVGNLQLPKKADQREDLKAAEQSKIASQANADLARHSITPSLDVSGSLALNARSNDLGTSVSNSLTDRYPLSQIAVRFAMPLDFGLIHDVSAAANLETEAAELAYNRKRFDLDRDWEEQSRNFLQAQRRLHLASEIEDIQKSKVAHEKTRLERGRSTLYQVIQMEQDYSLSRLNRLQITSEVLNYYAKLKLFQNETKR